LGVGWLISAKFLHLLHRNAGKGIISRFKVGERIAGTIRRKFKASKVSFPQAHLNASVLLKSICTWLFMLFGG